MFFFRAVIHLLIRSKIYQYIACQRSLRIARYAVLNMFPALQYQSIAQSAGKR